MNFSCDKNIFEFPIESKKFFMKINKEFLLLEKVKG